MTPNDDKQPMMLFGIPIIESDNIPDNRVMLIAKPFVTVTPLEVGIYRNEDGAGMIVKAWARIKSSDE